MKTKLKICGMKMSSNIQEVAELQPDYMGFILYPESKRYMGELLPEFVKNLPSGINRVGVFVDEDLRKVAELVLFYGLNTVQFHGNESPEYCKGLKGILNKPVGIIKAFGMDECFDFNSLKRYEEVVDYFLFDTVTTKYGGSGKIFDWSLLKNYTLSIPYFLSGGIGPDQVNELNKIKDVRFYAIDINSRFETEPGLKDVNKLIDFKKNLTI